MNGTFPSIRCDCEEHIKLRKLSANSHQPCTLGVPSSANKKTSVVEMRMLRCINGHTRRDKIRNMCIQGIE